MHSWINVILGKQTQKCHLPNIAFCPNYCSTLATLTNCLCFACFFSASLYVEDCQFWAYWILWLPLHHSGDLLKFCGCESLAGCSFLHFFSSVFGIHHLSKCWFVPIFLEFWASLKKPRCINTPFFLQGLCYLWNLGLCFLSRQFSC